MFDRSMMKDAYEQYALHRNNVWKINITINLTNTHEKKYTFQLLQGIVPSDQPWREHCEWSHSTTKVTTIRPIEEILKDINDILSIYGKNQKIGIKQLDISINAPNGHFRKTEDGITLKQAQEIITSQKQTIEDIDSSIRKSLCTRIFG